MNMENILWSPAAACPRCNVMFLAKGFLLCELTQEQLINGPYPNIHMSGNSITCPKCGNFARVLEYSPQSVKSELMQIRERVLDVVESELASTLAAIEAANPKNFDELYSVVKETSPSLAEGIQGMKNTLNWICLIGGTWAFFKELERTFQ
jgi:hypothetical protein